MRQLFFTIIISVFSSAVFASGIYQVSDSLDLFENITDISRQIQQRTSVSETINLSNEPETIYNSEDTVSSKEEREPIVIDTILLDSIPADTVRLDSVITDTLSTIRQDTTKTLKGIDFISRNELDLQYTRNENGTLQLPEYSYDINSLRGLTFSDTLFYNPLFLPMIYTGKILPRNLSFYSLDEDNSKGKLIPQDQTFA